MPARCQCFRRPGRLRSWLAALLRLEVAAAVPPHKRVTSATHSYSFTDEGTELCFDSPQALPEGSMSLATFLAKLVSGFLRGEKLSPDGSDAMLTELIGTVYGDHGADALP